MRQLPSLLLTSGGGDMSGVSSGGGEDRSRVVIALTLAALVVTSAVVRSILAQTTHSPWVLPDELIYGEMAKSVASGGPPAIRDTSIALGFGPLYPILIAPSWMVADISAAYAIAKVIGAVVMSLAAIPAYAFARTFVLPRSALVVAGTAVLVPSMAYSSLLLTENLFYPLVLLCVAVLARTLRRPRIRMQLALVGLVALAYLTRAQAGSLAVVYVAAVLTYGWTCGARGISRALRNHAVGIGAFAACALLTMAASLARGTAIRGVLGAYAEAPTRVKLEEVPMWVIIHLADMAMYVVVVPLAGAAVVAVLGLRRSADAPLRLYAAVAVPLIVVAVMIVSAFSSVVSVNGRDVLGERNLFYVMPVVLTGFALWIEHRMPRPRRLTTIVAVALVACVAPIPLFDLQQNAVFQAPGIVLWLLAIPRGPAGVAVVTVVVLVLLVLWFRIPQSRAGAPWVVTAGCFLVAGTLVVLGLGRASKTELRKGIGGERTWIDDRVGHDADVAVLWREPPRPRDVRSLPIDRVLWLNEFFNRSLGDVLLLGTSDPFPFTPVAVGENGAVRSRDGRRLQPRYALAVCPLGIHGNVLATDPGTGARLYRVAAPLRITSSAC